MAFEPVGIAARRVVASLGAARQERTDRAAANENTPRQVEDQAGLFDRPAEHEDRRKRRNRRRRRKAG